ncbi:MAG TPA: hypothetical protein VNQ77_08120 [Frankiaceae bacterium]|nr:hypothetical protein [Frankiaceae bacterium]
MRRVPYALAALLALTVASPASAAGCPLVADPAGDAGYGIVATPLTPALDIVGLDVASGDSAVVVRMSVLSFGLDPSSLGWSEWSAGWYLGGRHYGVRARHTTGYAGVSAEFDAGNGQPTPIPVSVDTAAGTLTWTVPRAWLPELATPGATFGTIRGITGEAFTAVRDFADGGATTYTDRSPGCVPAA